MTTTDDAACGGVVRWRGAQVDACMHACMGHVVRAQVDEYALGVEVRELEEGAKEGDEEEEEAAQEARHRALLRVVCEPLAQVGRLRRKRKRTEA